MLRQYREWAADRAAVTALEYGIIAAFFAVILLTIFSNYGATLTAVYTTATSAL